VTDAQQLAAIARVHELLDARRIDYWLFGGWAVDFYAEEVTRPHDDIDIAVWLTDHERIAALLAADGWMHAPHEDEDGGTGYERDGVRLELTFLERHAGSVCIPLRSGRAKWTDGDLGGEVAELNGVRARLIDLDLLTHGKSRARDDPSDASKDRADSATLSRLG
jgi:Aminoglycoside-2''-adenylyltransferase